MKISEVSKIIGLSVPTIRYYCDLGLVPSMSRDYEGERIFDDEAITWLNGIKFQRELGMPLSEIKQYLELSQRTGPVALKKRHAMLLDQQKRAQLDLQAATERLNRLNDKVTLEENIIKGLKSDSLSAARRFSQ